MNQPEYFNTRINQFNKAVTGKIDIVNWPEFSYKPEVEFLISLIPDGLFLKYSVEEHGCRALVTEKNGPVYKDSCVEFFADVAGDGMYYNFEFNCIGNILLGFGNGRGKREPAPIDIIDKIKCKSSSGDKPFETNEKIQWEIEILIPFEAFFRHSINNISRLRCNFYKCGDETPRPHYLSWKPVKTEKPDFHRPEFFGVICLK